jgi:TolA-binding protein
MIRYRTQLCCGLLLALTLLASAQEVPYYRTSHALLIGINQYRHVDTLAFAVKDVEDVRVVLVQLYGFPTEQIVTLTDGQATKGAITDALAALANPERVGTQDRVLIYFSGHGQTVKTPDGGEKGFLIPVDAQVKLGETENPAAYLTTCLPMHAVWDYLQMCPAKHVLLVADACYSGLLAKKRASETPPTSWDLRALSMKKARQVLTAGGAGEKTREQPALGHGIFTYKFLEELKARAAVGNPVITQELYSALKRSVVNASGGMQTPVLANPDEFDGEFLFVLPGSAPTPLPTNPPVTGGTVETPDTTAHLEITTVPAGATVLLDGVAQPKKTPCTLAQNLGVARTKAYEVGLTLPGHEDAVRTVTLERGKTTAVTIAFKPRVGLSTVGGTQTVIPPLPTDATRTPAIALVNAKERYQTGKAQLAGRLGDAVTSREYLEAIALLRWIRDESGQCQEMPEALTLLGTIESERGDYPEAALALCRVITDFPKSIVANQAAALADALPAAVQLALPTTPDLALRTGISCFKCGRYALADALLALAYQRTPHDPDTIIRYAESRYVVGAMELAKAAIPKEQPRTNATLQEAKRLLLRSIQELAKSDYVPEATFLLGKVLIEERAYPEAEARFLTVCDQYATSELAPQALYQLTLIYTALRNLDKLLAVCDRLGKQYPAHPLLTDALLRKAEYYYNDKDYATAAAIYQTISDQDPTPPRIELIRYRYATTCYKAGIAGDQRLFSQASRSYIAFATKYKDHDLADDALYWAAQIQHRLQEPGRALAILNQLLALYPGSDMKAYATRLRDSILEKSPMLQPDALDLVARAIAPRVPPPTPRTAQN